jgi:hypothetical protein
MYLFQCTKHIGARQTLFIFRTRESQQGKLDSNYPSSGVLTLPRFCICGPMVKIIENKHWTSLNIWWKVVFYHVHISICPKCARGRIAVQYDTWHCWSLVYVCHSVSCNRCHIIEPCGMDILTSVGIGTGWIQKPRFRDGISRDGILSGFSWDFSGIFEKKLVLFFYFAALFDPIWCVV